MSPTPVSLMNLPDGLSADSIDTLTILSSILSRVDLSSKNPAASTAGSPAAATPSQPPTDLHNGPLSVRDLPAATDELKHNLQRARMLVKQLPDLERNTQEQEEEMKGLEAKIKEQKAVLAQLMEMGVSAKIDKGRREQNSGGDASEA